MIFKSVDELLFPAFSILSLLLLLPISSSVSQIIKELCSSSSFSSFYFRHLDIFFRQVYVLEILSNLSAFILVTCSTHSLLLLLSTHSLIGWITLDSLICWLFILCSFAWPTIFLSTFISFASIICLVFIIQKVKNGSMY